MPPPAHRAFGMAEPPSTPSHSHLLAGSSSHPSSLFAQAPNHPSSATWNGSGLPARTPTSTTSSNNTYLMPTSPGKGRRPSNDGYRPRISRTTGSRPACLVNASVTYCGHDQIYAFGGFDQYTDEGRQAPAPHWLRAPRLVRALPLAKLTACSLQSRA